MIRLDEIKRDVQLCRACPLYGQRQAPVAGCGSPDARIVVVGGSLTKTEEKHQDPFTGKRKDMLDEWFEAAGLTFSHTFRTTVVKCAPRDWKFPEESADTCLPFTFSQLNAVSPLGIVTVGEHALKYLVLNGTGGRLTYMDAWAGKILRRKDLYGETRIAVVADPKQLLRQYQPLVQQASQAAIKRLASYVLAKSRGEPAPVTDVEDIRPLNAMTFQTRFRLFPAAPEEGDK